MITVQLAAGVLISLAISSVLPPSPVTEVDRLVGQMERVSPSSRAAGVEHWPGWAETPDERAARYLEIAKTAWDVAGETGAPSLFSGPRSREKTAAAILAVAFHESGFMKDVHKGPCYRGKGQTKRCDSGRAHCMMQIQMTHSGKTPDGYTGTELFADLAKCMRSGLRQLAASQGQCGPGSWRERFAIYASGRCSAGHRSARELADLVDAWSGRVGR